MTASAVLSAFDIVCFAIALKHIVCDFFSSLTASFCEKTADYSSVS